MMATPKILTTRMQNVSKEEILNMLTIIARNVLGPQVSHVQRVYLALCINTCTTQTMLQGHSYSMYHVHKGD